MPQPLARWNPERDVWETEQMDLFSEHSDVYSGTWPHSGMTRNGVAYALPTWEPPMPDFECSSSQPVALLPTPRVSDTNGPGLHGNGGMDPRTAIALLPTPSVADATGGHERRGGKRGDELLLPGVARWAAASGNWGKYTAAIERGESFAGRAVPDPTQPIGRRGEDRLSPLFVEWMMGLPQGWVTDTPTTPKEQIKALGNGVVPQQCTAALRDMLARTKEPA